MGLIDNGKGAKHMVREWNLTLSGERRMQDTNDMLLNCMLETYKIILTTVAPVNLILKK